MHYFSAETLQFFEELAGNNHKEWFHANKKRYEQFVKKPLYELVQAVIDEIKKDDLTFDLEVKDSVFRINRDIRFAKDKTPYKTHVAASINPGGRKEYNNPGIYVHIGLDGIMMGSGCYQPDKESLYRIRAALIEKASQVETILKNTTFRSLFGEIRGEKNKIIPKEFKPYIEAHPLILNKQFYFMAEYPSSMITRDDLVERIMQHRQVAKPWNHFLVSVMEG